MIKYFETQIPKDIWVASEFTSTDEKLIKKLSKFNIVLDDGFLRREDVITSILNQGWLLNGVFHGGNSHKVAQPTYCFTKTN